MPDLKLIHALEALNTRSVEYINALHNEKTGMDFPAAITRDLTHMAKEAFERALAHLRHLDKTERLLYSGTTRSGTKHFGTLPRDTDITDFVETKYRERWQSLLVFRIDDATSQRIKVGHIKPAGATSRKQRVWWVEGTSEDPAPRRT